MEKELKESKNIKENKTIYEIGYLIDPSLSEEDMEPVVSSIKTDIETTGAKAVSEGWPKKISLSYRITVSSDGEKKHFDTASFGWVKYEIDPQSIGTIKESLETKQEIIRFLIIKTSREDMVPFQPRIAPTRLIKETKESKKEPISISKEELDKTIEELVIK